MTRKETQTLADLEAFAEKHEVNIFCKRCQRPIVGKNGVNTQTFAVACQCREWRYGAGG